MKNTKRILALLFSVALIFSSMTLGLTATAAKLDPAVIAGDPGFINDDNALLKWSDGWGHSTGADYAGGTFAYHGDTAGWVKLSFTGTKITVLMESRNGFVDIILDGEKQMSNQDASGAWNVNSGETDKNYAVFSKDNLTNKVHTIEVHNANPYGYGWIYLVGFLTDGKAVDPTFPSDEDLTSASVIENSPYFVNDNNAAITYSGSWGCGEQRLTNEAVSDDSMTYNYAGGGCAYAAGAGAKATLYFKGSKLKVILGYSGGVFNIYVDGTKVVERATAKNLDVSDPDSVNTIAYSTVELDASKIHSVVVEDVDASWGRLVGFMAEEIVASPQKYVIEQDAGFINDTSDSITYSAGWGHGDQRDAKSEAAGDGRAYSGTGATTATLTFTGNNIAVIMSKGGLVNISIDNKEAVSVDTSAADWASTVFIKKGLANGNHTITLTNPQDNNWIYLEGFVVSDGPVLLDPREVEKDPGFINDNDSHLVFEGNWGYGDREENGRIEDANYAGGGYAYLGQSEGSVKLSFKGTKITVLMEKKQGNGFVDIFLDGQQMFSQDDDSGAWNTNTTGDKDPTFAVFSKEGLEDKVHTIEVRNANPYGYGWIYLTGFLTDGEAVDYVEPSVPDTPDTPGTSDTPELPDGPATPDVPDNSNTTDVPAKPDVNPDTGVALPMFAVCGIMLAIGVGLSLKKRTE